MDAVHSPFAAWESFYVIVGSSAAALTGLQFVVIVLGSEVDQLMAEPTTRAFGTPTVVHFSAILLVSAILSAPWHALAAAATALGTCGVAGVVYGMIVLRHARRQTEYAPVLEDWVFHGILPPAAYGVLLASAIALPRHPETSLFVIGATALLLLFVGIHNAWDAVTYLAARGGRSRKPKKRP